MAEVQPNQLARTALMGGAIGVVAALVVYGIARLAGVEFAFYPSAGAESSIPTIQVILLAIAGGVAGWLLALAANATQNPPRTFLIAAGIGLLLSFLAPILVTGAVSTALVLCLMHVAVAIPVVGMLERTLAGEEPGRRHATEPLPHG